MNLIVNISIIKTGKEKNNKIFLNSFTVIKSIFF